MNVIDSNILRSGMRAENRYSIFPQPGVWRFRAKHVRDLTRGRIPVRVKKARQNNNLELRF
jgi:hypothetical protein